MADSWNAEWPISFKSEWGGRITLERDLEKQKQFWGKLINMIWNPNCGNHGTLERTFTNYFQSQTRPKHNLRNRFTTAETSARNTLNSILNANLFLFSKIFIQYLANTKSVFASSN
jgi:hypothetical protein